MLFSLKSFVNKLSPIDMKQGFLSYKAATHIYTNPTLSFNQCCGSESEILDPMLFYPGIRDKLVADPGSSNPYLFLRA
jgi:hypothetical protein